MVHVNSGACEPIVGLFNYIMPLLSVILVNKKEKFTKSSDNYTAINIVFDGGIFLWSTEEQSRHLLVISSFTDICNFEGINTVLVNRIY